jgi:hypothetical protein
MWLKNVFKKTMREFPLLGWVLFLISAELDTFKTKKQKNAIHQRKKRGKRQWRQPLIKNTITNTKKKHKYKMWFKNVSTKKNARVPTVRLFCLFLPRWIRKKIYIKKHNNKHKRKTQVQNVVQKRVQIFFLREFQCSTKAVARVHADTIAKRTPHSTSPEAAQKLEKRRAILNSWRLLGAVSRACVCACCACKLQSYARCETRVKHTFIPNIQTTEQQ